jgi:hypothetical protein
VKSGIQDLLCARPWFNSKLRWHWKHKNIRDQKLYVFISAFLNTSLDGIAISMSGYKLCERVSIPGRSRDFSFRYNIVISSRVHSVSRSMSSGYFTLRQRNHLPLTNVEVKNVWRFISWRATRPYGVVFSTGQLYSWLYGVHEDIPRFNSNRVDASYMQ